MKPAARAGRPGRATAAPTTAPAAGTDRLRMKDLCAATGLSRQAIHFYIQQGLVDEGTKTGRNMAWYSPAHVERLRLIRRLQEERFLPLHAIRAMLADDTTALPASQQSLLAEIAARLPADVIGDHARAVRLDDALARHGVDAADAERLIELGLVPVRGVGGDRELAADSERVLALWSQWRGLGFTAERGFEPADLAIFVELADRLVAHETRVLLERFGDLPAATAAPLLARALPLVHATLIHFHQTAVRTFFATADVPTPRRPDAAR
ncbi:MAG: MerR family transcriptional regulator [Kofleriaceae bacterium]